MSPHADSPLQPATVLWRTTVPGTAAQRLWVDDRTGRVLVSDGWGVGFGALRLRALDMATGAEVAAVALGNQARAVARDGEDGVLVATDTRLFRLDADTLEVLQKWTTRIPRYSDQLLLAGGHVHAINASAAHLSAMRLPEGSVRRRVLEEDLQIHPTLDGNILAVAATGSVWLAQPGLDRPPQRIARTQPVCHSTMDGTGRLWLSLGRGRVREGNRVSWAAPTPNAGCMDPPYNTFTAFDLGMDFWQMASTQDGNVVSVAAATMTRGEAPRYVQASVASFRTHDRHRLSWVQAPEDFEIVSMYPQAGRAFATRCLWQKEGDAEVSELVCLRL
ncbi:YncE family protein [Xanthomonas medicagonis]|uniref:YncE family protein n=1 Tax=Xanthomonas medicagonis TaxID=3160841 RepID=UPI003518FF1C